MTTTTLNALFKQQILNLTHIQKVESNLYSINLPLYYQDNQPISLDIYYDSDNKLYNITDNGQCMDYYVLNNGLVDESIVCDKTISTGHIAKLEGDNYYYTVYGIKDNELLEVIFSFAQFLLSIANHVSEKTC